MSTLQSDSEYKHTSVYRAPLSRTTVLDDRYTHASKRSSRISRCDPLQVEDRSVSSTQLSHHRQRQVLPASPLCLPFSDAIISAQRSYCSRISRGTDQSVQNLYLVHTQVLVLRSSAEKITYKTNPSEALNDWRMA